MVRVRIEWEVTRGGLRPYLVTLADRCSFLCVSGQRGTIAKSMHEEHLCVVALTVWCEEPSSFRLPLTALCDRLLLFVYFQVNNGVLYCFWIMKILIIMVLCCACFNYCIVFVFIV